MSSYLSLPFVTKAKNSLCFWSVNSTGDHYRDVALGEEYALLTLKHMATEPGFYTLPGRVAADMAKSPATDINIGFWRTMTLYLNAGFAQAGERLLRHRQDSEALALARYMREEVAKAAIRERAVA